MADTFTRTSRRRQLVDLTTDLLAEHGVEGTTFVQVAERAGVSRGVLHYHFSGRADLFSSVVDAVYAVGVTEVRDAVMQADREGGPAAALEAFVRRSVHFYAERRREMAALSALYQSRAADTPARETRAEHLDEMSRTAALLRRGQHDGVVRACDVELMTLSVRCLLDLAVALTAAGTPPGPLADELAATVHAMTTSGGSA